MAGRPSGPMIWNRPSLTRDSRWLAVRVSQSLLLTAAAVAGVLLTLPANPPDTAPTHRDPFRHAVSRCSHCDGTVRERGAGARMEEGGRASTLFQTGTRVQSGPSWPAGADGRLAAAGWLATGTPTTEAT